MEGTRILIEWVAVAIEALAVTLMVVFIAVGTVRWLAEPRQAIAHGYTHYRMVLGKSLLVGLELLVAADIIRTVALQATLNSILSLGLLVLVRTFLGWTLTVEVEGRWPWQSKKCPDNANADAT